MKRIYSTLGATFLMLAAFSSTAYAQLTPEGVLDTVVAKYQEAASQWAATLTGYASYLFWGLAILSMVVTFGFMALKRADPMEFFAELFKFSFTTGFFWWLLTNGPVFAMSIINSLRKAGGTAAHVDGLGPSGIVDIGFNIFFQILDKTSVWSPIDSLIMVILGLGVLISLALIAANMVILIISGWMLAYGGIFFLGFGGARWTSEMAISYYKTALGIGAAVMGMTLIVGVGQSMINDFYHQMSAGLKSKEMAVILVVAIVMYKLANTVPNMLAGMVGGNAAAGAANVGGGTLLGAAALAGGAMATGGAMAMAGATNIAGGASALKAAFSAAQENMANGTGMFAGSGSGAGNVSSLAQAMGGGQGSSGGGSGSVNAAGAGASGGSGGGADSGAGSSGGDSSGSSSGAANSGTASAGSGAGSDGGAASSGESGGSEHGNAANSGESEGGNGAGAGAADSGAGSASGIAQGESAGQASGEGSAPSKADQGPWPFPTSASVKAAKDKAAQESAQPSAKQEAGKKPGLLRTGSMFAADMGANLAKGIGKVATDKAKENLASMKEAISNTAGGKVAAAIKEKTLAAKTDDAQEDSLSQGDNSKPAAPLSAEAQDEIKAFVNKAA